MENVDAVLNELNIAEFRRWLAKLTSLGYTNSYKVLNAKDYGVPQNRKRIFVVSMLGGRMLDFPKPCPDGRVLRDVLEDDVDESFYLSEDKVAKYRAHDERQRENGTGFGWRPSEPCGISPAVLTSPAKSSTNTIIITGNIEDPSKYECVNRIYGTEGIAPAVTTCQGGGQVPKIELKGARIRYLTPRECWRLMGFPDSAFEAARDVPTSKTQLYKQAGNSIAVPCLEAIFKAIYIDKTWHERPSLEAFL